MFFGLSGILKHCFLNVVFLNHLFLMHVVFWVSPLLWIAFEALLIYLFILLPIEYDTWNVTFACSSQAMHLFFLLLEDFGWESWFSPKSNICSTLSLEVMFPRHVAKCTKVKVLWRRLQHSAKNIRWTNCCSKKDIYILVVWAVLTGPCSLFIPWMSDELCGKYPESPSELVECWPTYIKSVKTGGLGVLMTFSLWSHKVALYQVVNIFGKQLFFKTSYSTLTSQIHDLCAFPHFAMCAR